MDNLGKEIIQTIKQNLTEFITVVECSKDLDEEAAEQFVNQNLDSFVSKYLR